MKEHAVDQSALIQARKRLSGSEVLNEAEASSLLGSFGLPVNPAEVRNTETGIIEATREMGFPVVLKTAEPGIRHKTEQRGVYLDIRNEEMLSKAYRELSERLGPNVMVAPCIGFSGVEMVLGMVQDEQFGPLIMLGFGGINVETMNDVVFAIPPFDTIAAKRMLKRLKHYDLLGRQRDGSTLAIGALCQTVADFSAVVAALGKDIEEIDMNPLIVHTDGCIALDALVIGCATIQ
jgi:succinyl-CoA synthetase beta subunit